MTEKELEQAVLGTTITLSLTVGEVNQVLAIIGKYPFDEVNRLVVRIHEEGQPQINKIVEDLKAKAEPEATTA